LTVSEYVHNKGIQLIFDTDIEDRVIAFDYEKLERILLNLLSNAVKFTESGGNICVNVRNSEEYIYISVKDTGIGIPENMQEKIFERFVQVDMSLSRNAEGSGIGLALVKYLVEMHEGGISLKSTPGEGSEFTVKIPCCLKENTVAATIANGKNPVCLEKAKVEFSDIYFKS
jgi:signal transduction histidine kinase